MATDFLPAALSTMAMDSFEDELCQNLEQTLFELHGGTISTDKIQASVDDLKLFPREIALAVSKNALRKLGNYATPRDFVELACKYHGVSKADLLAQGRTVFYELFHLKEPQHDLICSNWRVVYAVKREFVTLQNFFSAAEGEKPCWKQKRFAESFAYIDFTDENNVTKEYFLKGFEGKTVAPQERRHINFLGDYQECRQLLKQLGLAKLYLLPKAPVDPQYEEIFGFPPEEEKPASTKSTFDPEKFKLCSEMLDDMLEEYEHNSSLH